MARLFAERAITQVAYLLQHVSFGLNPELDKIRTENALDVVVHYPDSYHTERTAEFVADTVQIDIWSDRTTFDGNAANLPRWISGTSGPLRSLAEVFVRVTHANRDGATLGTMRKRSRRYSEAILRCLVNYPQLLDTTGYVLKAIPRSAEINLDDDTVTEGRRRIVDRVTIVLEVDLFESADGENSLSGGSLTNPTLVYETT